MAFQPHTEKQYLIGFHWFLCKGEDLEVAAERARMHPTVLFRAATGWTGNNEGNMGRKTFIDWIRGARTEAGAPCCGAHIRAGTKAIPTLKTDTPEARALRESQVELEKLKAQVERLLARAEGAPEPDEEREHEGGSRRAGPD